MRCPKCDRKLVPSQAMPTALYCRRCRTIWTPTALVEATEERWLALWNDEDALAERVRELRRERLAGVMADVS